MKELKMYGASDDLVEIEGDIEGADEYGAYQGAKFKLTATKGGCLEIHAIYAGSWAFAVCPQDGDYDRMPPWPITRSFGENTPYSETLTIMVPEDAVIEKV